MRHSLAWSMRAASNSSSGMVSMYWRSKNTPVGVAMAGKITPHKLLSRPTELITRNTGTKMMVGGIIRVAMISKNTAFWPRNWYLDRAKAAIELISNVSSVATTVMNTLFHK